MNTHATAHLPTSLVATEIVVRVCESADIEAVRKVFPALPTDGPETTLVAWLGGRPVGHVQLRWQGSVHHIVRTRLRHTPEVRRLRVHADARGLGAAKQLLAAVEQLAEAARYRHVGLAVGVDNQTAIRLYEAIGYTSCVVDDFESSMGMDEHGRPYTHLVQYMVKAVATEIEMHATA